MPQLHCYVPETIAQQLQQQAAQLGLSMSAYLAELVKRDVGAGWPEGFESAQPGDTQHPRIRPCRWVNSGRLGAGLTRGHMID